jgi:hypothetical protein
MDISDNVFASVIDDFHVILAIAPLHAIIVGIDLRIRDTAADTSGNS